jgi:hypothetical protein
MDLKTIVSEGLKATGYDGLVNPGVCGCTLDDLMPCDEPWRCEGAYRRECAGCPEVGSVETYDECETRSEYDLSWCMHPEKLAGTP